MINATNSESNGSKLEKCCGTCTHLLIDRDAITYNVIGINGCQFDETSRYSKLKLDLDIAGVGCLNHKWTESLAKVYNS